MTLIENYLEHLKSYLPDNLKQEVSDELESVLMDKKEEQEDRANRPLTNDEEAQLLKELGHPMQVASSYLPNQELIGQEYFPAFKETLKTSLIIVFVATFLLNLSSILDNVNVIQAAITVVFSTLETGLFVFAVLTIIFYLIQQTPKSKSFLYEWSPQELPNTSQKLKISRVDSLIELAVYGFFFVLWLSFFHQPIELGIKGSNLPVQLSPEWSLVYWPICFVFVTSLFVSIHKFIKASWHKVNLIVDIIASIVALITVAAIIQFESFIIFDHSIIQTSEAQQLLKIANSTVYSIAAVIALICVWDIVRHISRLKKK
ncbi:hypothetical protein [Pleionea sediminis]|uniref:hypothetical protein n=1 Tax=Pleionea sediminis TaxID=2569479 RepID=UPI001185952D|nr:hypothetical protein [Pleionea sediminis]